MKQKQIVKLYARNKKGFQFIKKEGQIHSATFKKDGRVILRDKNNKKIVIKDKDKRFDVENYTNMIKYDIRPYPAYPEYFE